MISESTKDMLNRLPLDEVMENNGYHFYGASRNKDKRFKMYVCPFHGDSDPSFRVDIAPAPGKQYCGTYCFACKGASGDATYGAIQLQQRLLQQAGEPCEFMDACKRLARDFHIVLEKEDYNSYWRRQEHEQHVEPQDEIKLCIADRPFTDEELRALGCKVDTYTRRDYDSDLDHAVKDGEGNLVRRYSFSPSYYRKGMPEAWDSRILTRMFNLYPLRQDWEGEEGENYAYISRKEKVGGGDELRSYKIYATRSYPIFVFKYEDKDGWWARKYEPYCKPEILAGGRQGRNLKFTWWYEGDRRRTDMQHRIYGDNDVLRAMQSYDGSSDVEQTDDTRAPLAEKSYLLTVGEKDVENKRKVFDKIIICSGPRDALSTYFHSDAHVVWPHSETAMIPDHTMKRLFAICDKLYVMYDIDETGVNAMNRMGLMYPELRLLDLPEELRRITDRRTGKPCKDAEQYFNNYNPTEHDELISDINEHFADMLVDAPCMKFWDTEYGTKREKGNTRKEVDKFTINYSHLMRFLQAKGIYNYKDESGASHYVLVKDNIVEIIDDKEFMTKAKVLMKKYLFAQRVFNSTSLKNAISTQKKVTTDSLKEIRSKELNFKTWGKEYDWFMFRNCAAKVTKDGITAHPYREVDGHVNQRAILDGPDFRLTERLFEIKERPDYRVTKERFEKQMADRHISPEAKGKLTSEFIEYQTLWRWELTFSRTMEDMPPCMQFVWDTCRIHWRKEEMGHTLTPEEEQQQKMHFVNKAASVGYLLSRYRTDAMQQMTTFTDYKIQIREGSYGGTGKTSYQSLIESVRKLCFISGDNFNVAAGQMATNFQEFKDTEDQVVMIDDLKGDIRGEEFKNLTTQMTVKTLYQNKYSIPKDRVPKIFCTMNKELALSNQSVYRRCFSSYTSDYYHPSNKYGTELERTPTTKFGKDFVLDATEEEYNYMRNMMLQFCQFYLQTQEVIKAPMDGEGKNRQLYENVEDDTFMDWANDFFSDENHYCRPFAKEELLVSYLIYRKEGSTNVTRSEMAKAEKDFFRWIKEYCKAYKVDINPYVVSQPKNRPSEWEDYSDAARREFRMKETSDNKTWWRAKAKGEKELPMVRARFAVWLSEFEGDKLKEPRTWKVETKDCLFFFRPKDVVPLDAWDLMTYKTVDKENY